MDPLLLYATSRIIELERLLANIPQQYVQQ